MNPSDKLDVKSQEPQRPAIGEPVWVQCQGYRCMAVLDKKGHWRAFYNNAELSGAIQVVNDFRPQR